MNAEKLKQALERLKPIQERSYTSLTGEYTGLWRRNSDFAPNKLVGIGMVAQGFDVNLLHISRTKKSYNKKVKFIFKEINRQCYW